MKAAPVLLLRDVLSLIPLLLPFAFLLLPSFRDVRLEARALFVEGDARGDLVGESHPAVRSAAEGLGGARFERASAGLPHAALDLYVRTLEADDVEGVRLVAAHARRGGRAGLHEE